MLTTNALFTAPPTDSHHYYKRLTEYGKTKRIDRVSAALNALTVIHEALRVSDYYHLSLQPFIAILTAVVKQTLRAHLYQLNDISLNSGTFMVHGIKIKSSNIYNILF